MAGKLTFGAGGYQSPNRRIAEMLMQQAKTAPPITSNMQGLASMLRQGLAGWMTYKDQAQQTAAQDAITKGFTAQPWVNPDTGQASAAPAGGLGGALAAEQSLNSNPYAGRLASQLATMQYAQKRGDAVAAQRQKSGLADYLAKKRVDQQFAKPTPGVDVPFPAAVEQQRRNFRATPKWVKPSPFDFMNSPIGQPGGATEPGAMASRGKNGGGLTPQEIFKQLPINIQNAARISGNPGKTISDYYTRQRTPQAPPGYRFLPNGNLEAIPGGAPAVKAAGLAKKMEFRHVVTARAGNTVIQDLGRAVDLVKNDWSASGVPALFGVLLPKSVSSAAEAKAFVESALSNIGLDRLQQMREASPTGGALGQVPVQQQKRLEQVLGSLDVTQKPSVVVDNINRAQNIYMDIVYGTPEQIQSQVDVGAITPAQARPLMARKRLSFDQFGNPQAGEGPSNNLISPSPKEYDYINGKLVPRGQ